MRMNNVQAQFDRLDKTPEVQHTPANSSRNVSQVIWCDTFFSRLKGMLRKQKGADHMILMLCRAIHTWGMSYPIDVAFFDANGVVSAVYRQVMPYSRRECRDAYAVVERASDTGRWLCVGDSIGRIIS